MAATALKKANGYLDDIQARVDLAVEDAKNGKVTPPTTPQQKAERDRAQQTAMKAIDDMAAIVQKTAARMQARIAAKAKSKREPTKWEKRTRDQILQKTTADDPDPYAELLETQVTDTSDAVKLAGDLDKIDGVMDAFNNALAIPNLDSWSAPLETIPMVAIQPAQGGGSSQIYYTSTQLDPSGKSTVDSWTLFSPLPAEPASGETTHLFSYQGSLFATIGTTAWQLKPANTTDPDLYKAAVDDWTKAWDFPWVAIGQALPVGGSQDVVQYYTYNSDNTVASQGVVMLGTDYSLSYASGDITTNTSFTTLNFSPKGGITTAPQFTKIASYNSSLWGYTNTSGQSPSIYEISVDGNFTSWSIANVSQMTDQIGTDFSQYSVTDITAVDSGLAVSLSDGNVWKEIFQPTNQNGKVITTWQKYLSETISTGKLNTLGAACPGVIVDMKILITYLKSNYIQNQTNVLGTIPLLQAYIGSHQILLGKMENYINQYNSATDPAQKKQIAEEAGSDAITQANYFGNAISSSLGAINDAVVNMGRQSAQVSSSLQAQVNALTDKINGLKSTLNTDQQQLDKLQAGFWASLAVSLVGFVVLMAGVFTANPYVIALGAFMTVGGLISFAVLSTKIEDLQQKISSLQDQINQLSSTRETLQNILDNVKVMTKAYCGMDSFWFTMYTVSESDLDETKYGTQVVTLPIENVQSALNYDTTLSNALTDYTNTLGAQGISVPSDADNLMAKIGQPGLKAADVENDILLKGIEATHDTFDKRRNAAIAITTDIFNASTEQHRSNDKKAWLSLMKKADSLLAQALKTWAS